MVKSGRNFKISEYLLEGYKFGSSFLVFVLFCFGFGFVSGSGV
jgi:hypothetical protein